MLPHSQKNTRPSLNECWSHNTFHVLTDGTFNSCEQRLMLMAIKNETWSEHLSGLNGT